MKTPPTTPKKSYHMSTVKQACNNLQTSHNSSHPTTTTTITAKNGIHQFNTDPSIVSGNNLRHTYELRPNQFSAEEKTPSSSKTVIIIQ
jgi:hypothetical protein